MKKIVLLIIILTIFQHLCINAQCTGVTITTQPQNQNDSIPGAAHFNITVAGTAPFNYYWYVNGTLTDSTINSGSTSNTYNTPPLAMADSNNTYYCIITNCAGANTVTSNTVGLVCIPVSITIQPLSQTFTAGNNDTISFSVTVNGTPPFTYKWYGPPGTGTLLKTTTDTVGHRSIYSFYAHPVVYGMNGNTYSVDISNHCGGGGGVGLVSANAVITVGCPAMATPVANINGIQIGCSANITLHTPSVTGATYHWTGGFGITSSSSQIAYDVAPGGYIATTYTYSVTITINGCTSPAGTVSFYVTGLPVISNSPQDQTICSGGIISYTPQVINAYGVSTGAQYMYSGSPCIMGATNGYGNINDVLINNGATPCSITYTVTPSLDGCNGYPDYFTVTVNPTPHVTVTSPTICAGDTATITASGAATYTWSAGATPVGIDSATASPASTTTYTVTGTNTYSCHSTAVSTVTVVSAINTTVTQTADTLTSNQSGASYQWIICGNGNFAIAGATNQSYTPTSNGTYASVIIVGACKDTSDCVVFYTVGLNGIDNNQSTINISPNPFTEETTITCSEEQKNTTINITDVLGKTVKTLMLKGSKSITLYKGEMSKGVYFVELIKDTYSIIRKKIVIE